VPGLHELRRVLGGDVQYSGAGRRPATDVRRRFVLHAQLRWFSDSGCLLQIGSDVRMPVDRVRAVPVRRRERRGGPPNETSSLSTKDRKRALRGGSGLGQLGSSNLVTPLAVFVATRLASPSVVGQGRKLGASALAGCVPGNRGYGPPLRRPGAPATLSSNAGTSSSNPWHPRLVAGHPALVVR
jgi:hypothetical protein